MLNLRPQDAIHKSYLNRLLIEIIDNPPLSFNLAFKGGTCAEMLGFLDRFSVDLDFDVIENTATLVTKIEFHRVFNSLGLKIVKETDSALFFQLKYQSQEGKRNTLKVSANDKIIKSNEYKVQYLAEIDRLANCQTIETMFANKLVAVMDRYALHKTIAGRDIYDVHNFFIKGYRYKEEIIFERTGLKAPIYLKKLAAFIKKNATQTIINEDLNTLLPFERFRQIRKVLIPETLSFLR